MKLSTLRDIDMKGSALFIPTLWLMMAVALLSAVAPLGPPASRLTGSAFNPATTSVVLKARSPTSLEVAHASALPKDEPATVPAALLWLLPLAVLALGAGSAHPAPFRAIPCRILRSGALLSGHCARGPPASS